MAPWPAVRTHLRFMMAAAFALCASAACLAQGSTAVAEYQVKAAYLFKFLNFVEWPPQAADGPLVIGVLEADSLAAELTAVVSNRLINGRTIVTHRLRPGDPLTGLHVLFIGRMPPARLAPLLAAAKGQPLLVVTDSEEAFAAGSSINFVQVGNKIRFDVALRPAELAHLKISSRLLSVARRVVASPS